MNEQQTLKAFFALPPRLWELIRSTAAAFVLLIMIGFTLGMLRPEAVEPLMRMFTDAAASAGLYQVEGGVLMATILANNLLSLLLIIAAGLVPVLRLSALSLGLNAMLIGGLAAYYRTSGLGLAAYLAGTLPHGLTELTALVLSCAAGFYLCYAVNGAVFGDGSAQRVARVLSECLRVYTHWVVPLLVLSAFLEAFVTPLIFNLFL
ncbi:MAG: stage II sporulation protein M [Oscillospiraceae bacterium]|nr:stage II sporulation protein M [Oscillospiraceae bacterium]